MQQRPSVPDLQYICTCFINFWKSLSELCYAEGKTFHGRPILLHVVLFLFDATISGENKDCQKSKQNIDLFNQTKKRNRKTDKMDKEEHDELMGITSSLR